MKVEIVEKVHAKRGGYCHLCHKTTVRRAYGSTGRGAWEVDHLKPRSKGGTDHLNNLEVAHVECNRLKGNRSNETVRAEFGVKGLPLTQKQFEEKKGENQLAGFLGGGALGGWLFGPGGAVVMAVVGALAAGPESHVDLP